MNASDRAPEGTEPEPVVTDPILDLIAQREAQEARGASDTQAFMAYMSRVNADEFGTQPFGWPVSRWILVVGLAVAVVAVVAWTVWA